MVVLKGKAKDRIYCFLIPKGNGQSSNIISVWITYNEDNNVIMTVTGGVSQLRGSEFLRNRQLFPGHRPVGLSRKPAF